jgi:hypothetical protein
MCPSSLARRGGMIALKIIPGDPRKVVVHLTGK